MQSINPQLDPGPILQTACAFWSSKVLLTAVEFGVFTKLRDRQLTGEELGAELGMTGSRVAQMRMASIRPASLDAPIGDEDSDRDTLKRQGGAFGR